MSTASFTPSRSYLTAMAAYNAWMNEKLYAICDGMTDEERKRDRGAFFRSIHHTLDHLVFVDHFWMSWFQGRPPANTKLGAEMFADWDALKAERVRMDAEITAWAATVPDDTLAGDLVFDSLTLKTKRKLAFWHAVIHYFNHQTHHRGQVTTLLTQAGKEMGATDLHRLPGIAISL